MDKWKRHAEGNTIFFAYIMDSNITQIVSIYVLNHSSEHEKKDFVKWKHSSVDIEVIGTVFIFIFFYKRYFKHFKHKQNKVINTVFNFIFILWKIF